MIHRFGNSSTSRSCCQQGIGIVSRSSYFVLPNYKQQPQRPQEQQQRHHSVTVSSNNKGPIILSSARRPYNNSSIVVPHQCKRRWFASDSSTIDDDDHGDDDDMDTTEVEEETNKEEPTTTPSSSSFTNNSSAPPHLLKPKEIVSNLDRHIVGQNDAKRSVAIAMRNRWRRKLLPKDLRAEVTPRNVLMIGPTGCGKTEVARRMAALSDAPFIKVEATKFTEVGYHGRDVDQIVRDLMDISINLTKKRKTEQFRELAKAMVEDRILDLLLMGTGSSSNNNGDDANENASPIPSSSSSRASSSSRESFRNLLRQGSLDEQEVEVDVPIGLGTDKAAAAGGNGAGGVGGIFTVGGDTNNPNLTAMTDFLNRMSSSPGGGGGGKKGGGGGGPPAERKKMSIAEARSVILEIELERMLENTDLKKEAIESVEESGIVFIDEIDKICSSKDFMSKSADASAEGVQRDLLPLVEGTTISTKYGNVNTDYILFIASGAFHSVKPSDMLPELQGRLPIRVELNGLTEDDLYKILTEPVANLLRQQSELLATEGVTLNFEDDAVREIARMAALLNRTVENIGARRLHTVIERIMEILSFEAAEMEEGEKVTVDKALVEERLSDVMISSDLSRYIL